LQGQGWRPLRKDYFIKFNISKWQKFWAYDFGWHKWFAWHFYEKCGIPRSWKFTVRKITLTEEKKKMLPKYVVDAALRMQLKKARADQLDNIINALVDMQYDMKVEAKDMQTRFEDEGYDLSAIASESIAKQKEEDKKNA